MLIRYSVGNFLSFKNKNVLEMAAIQSNDNFPSHIFYDDKYDFSMLKSAAIYGANASGKSNLIKSISFARNVILNGFKKISTLDKHFRLDNTSSESPSFFRFEIKVGKNYYDYGFAVILKKKLIVEEWLFKRRKNGETCIFYRNQDFTSTKVSFKSFPNDKSKFKVYCDDIQSDQLILTELSDKNWETSLKELPKVLDWFKYNLGIVFPNDNYGGITFITQYKELEKYLDSFDTGIETVELIEKDFDTWIKDLDENIKNDIQNAAIDMEKQNHGKNIPSDKPYAGLMLSIHETPCLIELYKTKKTVKILSFKHLKDGNEIFELINESDGTKRLVELIPLIHSLSKRNKTLIIDEIDRSFHPALTKKIFEIFYNITKNNESQLIVTTHDTNLLDLNFLRTDEIFFVDRESDKSSQIYSLAEFKNILTDDSLSVQYFKGRYGGIPLFGEFNKEEPCDEF